MQIRKTGGEKMIIPYQFFTYGFWIIFATIVFIAIGLLKKYVVE